MRSDSRNYTTEKSLSRACYISRSPQQMYCMDFRMGEPEPTTACSHNHATHDGKKLWRFCYMSERTQQLYQHGLISLSEPERICSFPIMSHTTEKSLSRFFVTYSQTSISGHPREWANRGWPLNRGFPKCSIKYGKNGTVTCIQYIVPVYEVGQG